MIGWTQELFEEAKELAAKGGHHLESERGVSCKCIDCQKSQCLRGAVDYIGHLREHIESLEDTARRPKER